MSKYIHITPEQIESTVEEFRAALTGARMLDGKINFTRKFDVDGAKATVRFTPMAWEKMTLLLKEFDKEVAWHGVCERVDGEENTYLISDIMVYPQVVSAATVQMDETEYAKWLQDNGDDERFYQIHFQGHSHVNMATSPSGVDLEHQASIVNQLKKNGFYLFAIYNKRHDCNWFIYDMQKNIFFENKDVSVVIGDGESLDDFVKEAKSMVKNNTPTYTGYTQSTYTPPASSSTQTKTAQSTAKTYEPYNPLGKADIASRPKTQIGAAWPGKDAIKGQTTIPFPPERRSYGTEDDEYAMSYLRRMGVSSR